MHTYSVRDLREKTGDLIRDSEGGELSLVTKRGKPVFLAVPLSEQLIKSGLPLVLAINLYCQQNITLVKAAKVAGMSTEEFIESLALFNIPVVDYDLADLTHEFKAIKRKAQGKAK